jgi:Flp pilus assembly secretin CpaC
MKKICLAALVGLAAATSLAGFSMAGQPLGIEIDQSQVMKLPSTPGVVVIGNPAVADVTIQDKNLFIHGRGFGETNLIILDLQGNPIADFDLTVKRTAVNAVALFRAEKRYSYACAPWCEVDIQVGDPPGYVQDLITNTSGKIELSTGNKSAEAEAPQAPQ